MRAFDADGIYWKVTGKGFAPEGEFFAQNSSSKVADCDAMVTALTAGSLVSDSELVFRDGSWAVNGSPTDGALVVAATKADITKTELLKIGGYEVIRRFPFDSSRKLASAIVRRPNGEHMLAVVGAPDVLLSKSMENQPPAEAYRKAELSDITSKEKLHETQVPATHIGFNRAMDNFARDALRTLAVLIAA